jgi:5-methylcytosine-specific restriction endonuclease McrA
VPPEERDGQTSKIPDSVKNAVLIRDGHRCRYCGMPVISAEIRKMVRRLDEDGRVMKLEEGIYAKVVPWIHNDEANEHSLLVKASAVKVEP